MIYRATSERLQPPPHYTPVEFENGDFSLKTHQMFFAHTMPEEFKNATITGHFRFVFEENSGREITNLVPRVLSLYRTLGTRLGNHVIIVTSSFRKAPFSKCFPSTRKRKAGVFKFLRFEKWFLKVPFS